MTVSKVLPKIAAVIVPLLSALAFVGVSPASAEVPPCGTCSPWWHLTSMSLPGNLPPGGTGEVLVVAQDLGDAPMGSESEIVLTDRLPEGVAAEKVSLGVKGTSAQELYGEIFCRTLTSEVKCTVPGEVIGGMFGYVEIYIKVAVSETAKSGATNRIKVAGGEAPEAAIERPLTVDGAPTQFGVSRYELLPENTGGSPDRQAGSHPFQLTTDFTINQTAKPSVPPAALKDLRFDLPPGLVGNPTPFPECPLSKFLVIGQTNRCPADTVVGVASVTRALGGALASTDTEVVPLFELVPSTGEPARFGFLVTGIPVYLDTSVRTGGDYGVTVTVDNITQIVSVLGSTVTFWGVPGDPRHDAARNWGCLDPELGALPCDPLGQENPPPLLTLPTACAAPPQTTLEADSWEQEGAFTAPFEYAFKDNLGQPAAMDGCNREPFPPSIKVTPDGQQASTPTGLNVDVHVDQESILAGEGIAASDVQDITVALPEGIAINPAASDGLEGCSEALVGFEGFRESPATEPGVSNPAFTPTLPGSIGSSEPLEPGVNFCANASKIGEATIHSPLLPNPLKGFVYLADQEANPFGGLVAMYIVVEDPVSGTVVKLAGQVHLQPGGQIVATFTDNPQLPFEDAELHFFGGERAPLASPSRCGSYTTNASFTPWSGNAASESSSTLDVTSGPNGSPCPGAALPFSPSLTAGMTNNNAGAFSPFTMTMSRASGQQNLQAVEVKLPPGLSGILSNVELCPEPQADQGLCGSNSLIGETTVSVGVGGDPFTVTGGRVYITGPYEGAPFGLSIVNPAKAGPYDLADTRGNHPPCDCVVVRAKIEVNPITAALTITTDNSGPYKIPTSIEGIPLQIQHVNVTIDRSGFQFNPTDCNKLEVGGTLDSAEGASEALSIPFQVTNCAALAFKPKLTASTAGKSTRTDGTSLQVKLHYPAGPDNANIARVKVELPKALPSRLTTLRKACVASVFEANPADCPAASIIGHATATTPELPVPLTGPAYFVSHGGEAFPSLIVVLQGYGVTVHLVGTTFISSAGITSSTFKTVPDAPVGSFELNLPAGPDSALTGLGNLCKKTLTMPTEFVGQNGAEIHTTTKLAVTGCGKTKKVKHRKRPSRKHGKRHGHGRRKK